MAYFSQALLIGMATFAAVAASQTRAGSGSGPEVIRSSTTLVQVDLVARDKSGTAITSLTKDDFEVFDNGRRQNIVFFSGGASGALISPRIAPGVFTNQVDGVPTGATRSAVVLLDWLNTSLADRPSTRDSVVRMLQETRSAALVELFVLDNSLRVVQDLTNRPRELARKIGVHGGDLDMVNPSSGGLYDASAATPAAIFPAAVSVGRNGPAGTNARAKAFYLERRILTTLEALSAIADHLAGVPGHKILIWVSSGFPLVIDSRVVPGVGTEARPFGDEVSHVVRKLNAARTALYPIDARGLSVDPGAYVNIESMKEMAGRTGGRAWYNRNDLSAGVKTAIQELQSACTLGFYLTEAAAPFGEHRLRIRTRRPGVRLSYQETYYDLPGRSEDRLLNAVRFPVTLTDIPFEVRTAGEDGTLTLHIRMPIEYLTLTLKGDRWNGELGVITRFPGLQSVEDAMRSGEKIQLALRPRTRQQMLREGFTITKVVAVPDKAPELQVVLFDSASGKTGSLVIPIELSDSASVRR